MKRISETFECQFNNSKTWCDNTNGWELIIRTDADGLVVSTNEYEPPVNLTKEQAREVASHLFEWANKDVTSRLDRCKGGCGNAIYLCACTGGHRQADEPQDIKVESPIYRPSIYCPHCDLRLDVCSCVACEEDEFGNIR